jgi:hypothetical protein
MTKAELLRRVAALHEAWSLKHGDEVPVDPDGDSMWNADMNAPAAVDDPLNAAIKKLLDEYHAEQELRARAAAVIEYVRHMPGKHDQSSHAHGGGAGIRQSLQDASTTGEVSAVLASEASALTGRNVVADLAGADVDVAREYAEGCLRGYEKFPKCQVDQVIVYGPGSARPDAFTGNPGDMAVAGIEFKGGPTAIVMVHTIGFNAKFSNQYGTDTLAHAESTGFTTRGGHMSTAAHEYGHHASRVTGMSMPGGSSALSIARGQAADRGVTPATHIRQQISKYASKNQQELVAEAFADVVLHGDLASGLSSDIYAEMTRRYESRP